MKCNGEKKWNLYRGIPTHRGWVKKIRFAPGKGNQKLLVMYADGAEVWDTKDVRITTHSFIDCCSLILYNFPVCLTPLLCMT